MKLLLIDDEERLVFEANLGDTKMHVKGTEPEYKPETFGSIKVPTVSKPVSYSLNFKTDLVAKENYAMKIYPDRMEEANLEIQSCYTRGKAKCIHEQSEQHDLVCTEWICYC